MYCHDDGQGLSILKLIPKPFPFSQYYFCRFLEETNCVGMCTNLCKMPSQLFIKDTLGISVNMVPSKYKLIPNTNTHYSKISIMLLCLVCTNKVSH